MIVQQRDDGHMDLGAALGVEREWKQSMFFEELFQLARGLDAVSEGWKREKRLNPISGLEI